MKRDYFLSKVSVLTLDCSFDFRIVLQARLQVEELTVPAVNSVTGHRLHRAAVFGFAYCLKLRNRKQR